MADSRKSPTIPGAKTPTTPSSTISSPATPSTPGTPAEARVPDYPEGTPTRDYTYLYAEMQKETPGYKTRMAELAALTHVEPCIYGTVSDIPKIALQKKSSWAAPLILLAEADPADELKLAERIALNALSKHDKVLNDQCVWLCRDKNIPNKFYVYNVKTKTLSPADDSYNYIINAMPTRKANEFKLELILQGHKGNGITAHNGFMAMRTVYVPMGGEVNPPDEVSRKENKNSQGVLRGTNDRSSCFAVDTENNEKVTTDLLKTRVAMLKSVGVPPETYQVIVDSHQNDTEYKEDSKRRAKETADVFCKCAASLNIPVRDLDTTRAGPAKSASPSPTPSAASIHHATSKLSVLVSAATAEVTAGHKRKEHPTDSPEAGKKQIVESGADGNTPTAKDTGTRSAAGLFQTPSLPATSASPSTSSSSTAANRSPKSSGQ